MTRQRLDVVEQVLSCTNCELHSKCTAPVAFRGPAPAAIAVVGEAPGSQEDQQGQPFVGPSGQLLFGLFDEVGLSHDMAICNTVSCWPQGTPTWDHIHACDGNKWAQLDLIDPGLILLAGRVALKAMRPDLDIKRGRGRAFRHRGRVCFATYHPAAALRNASFADSMRDDLATFKQLVDAGPAAWLDFICDTCAACPLEAEWYEDSGIAWCPVHLTGTEAGKHRDRQAIVAADHTIARTNTATRAAQRRDAALQAVEEAADSLWLDTAWLALRKYLHEHEEFFVDDFWAVAKVPKPREARALGPLVLRAARKGLMEKSGAFRKSAASNMTEKPVWRSLIYTGAPLGRDPDHRRRSAQSNVRPPPGPRRGR